MGLIGLEWRVSEIDVSTRAGVAGQLRHDSYYSFIYRKQADDIALSMPLRLAPYNHGAIHPIFTMNLPEGYVRRYIADRLARQCRVDDMTFLALQGDKGLGRLQFNSGYRPATISPTPLGTILKDSDATTFQGLIDKYWLNGTVAGIQPKALVTSEKATTLQPDLIVKTGGNEYPGLSFNEFACMSIAKAAGMVTPEFWLSDHHDLFVMKRFDLQDGQRLGMEDLSVLMGGRDKYTGSYEAAAKCLVQYGIDRDQVERYFDQVALGVLVGNGDGHLRNFSVLYRGDDMKPFLSPVYDVVCTLQYPELGPELALKMNGDKRFPAKQDLIRFGGALGVRRPGERLERLAEACFSTLRELSHRDDAHGVLPLIQSQAERTMTAAPRQLTGRTAEDAVAKPRKTDRYLDP